MLLPAGNGPENEPSCDGLDPESLYEGGGSEAGPISALSDF